MTLRADQLVVSAGFRDVTKRAANEQHSRGKNDEADKVARERDTFLASMSHELRTPLNAIIGFTGTLLMELPGPLNADQARQLRTVESSGKHLLAIINDLLELAKIESGAHGQALEPVDCGELVDSVTSSLRPLAVNKGLGFDVTVPKQPVIVKSDARALAQMLLNLVSNAITFTDTGSIRVVLEDAAGGPPRIAVTDTGPGIGIEDLETIFNAFERGTLAATPGRQGTGLGLYISHKLADLIGARVSVETVLGSGSTFAVVLDGPR